MEGEFTAKPENHHNLHEAAKAVEGLVECLDGLENRITGRGANPAGGNPQLNESVPSLAEMLEHGPDRIFDAVSNSRGKIEEIERALFGG